MRHAIDPSIQIGPQARAAGFTEPYRNVVLYRFIDAVGALLYVGITSRPTERWQKHRRQAQWWPQVSEVLVEVYAQRHQAEAAELAAIKSERPLFNVHAAPTRSVSDVDEIPTSFTRYSRVVLPRGGVGVGVGEGVGSSSLNQVQTVKAVEGQRRDGLDLG